jgi:hypothetical protein
MTTNDPGSTRIGTGSIDIDADDARLGTEIFAPQLQRAATADAELENARSAAQIVAQRLKVPVVYCQIVVPLMRNPAVMRIEEPFEFAGRPHAMTCIPWADAESRMRIEAARLAAHLVDDGLDSPTER